MSCEEIKAAGECPNTCPFDCAKTCFNKAQPLKAKDIKCPACRRQRQLRSGRGGDLQVRLHGCYSGETLSVIRTLGFSGHCLLWVPAGLA
ncbi:hypothetical protein RRG08_018134 [Elysia crispata]|uniref:Uncharacterized protein n=1 Tax=Elysia crispata TaxID=231223 RepID=A0AAE0YD12_9GAST|nr:hypothetical protein RRG08_018134 [Elysia crispata]